MSRHSRGRRLSQGVALATFCLLAVVLWVGGPMDGSSAWAVEPEGTLIFLQGENFIGSWDPTAHTRALYLRWEPIAFDHLFRFDEDNNLVPHLAVSWEQVSPTTTRVSLRKGVKFHDGSSFDAADVKASIEYYTRDASLGKVFMPGTIHADVVDDNTVDIYMDKPTGSLLNSVAMIPMMTSEDVANPDKLAERYNGTGPFKWGEFSGDELRLVANPDYWRGPPKLKEVVIRFVTDPNARLLALQSGQAHIIDRVGPEHIPVIEADPNLIAGEVISVEQMWIQFSFAQPPFSDNQKLRQAVATAIDRETIVDDIMGGHAYLADSFISPASYGYAPAPNPISYSPERAKQLLSEAGYPGGEGLPVLQFDCSVGYYPLSKEYCEYITQNLQDVGFQVKLNLKELSNWVQTIFNPEAWHIQHTGWFPASVEPDLIIRTLYYSPGKESHVSDPEIDAALDAELAEMDPVKRAQVLRDVTIPTLMERMPAVPLFAQPLTLGISKKVKGFEVLSTGHLYLENVSVEP